MITTRNITKTSLHQHLIIIQFSQLALTCILHAFLMPDIVSTGLTANRVDSAEKPEHQSLLSKIEYKNKVFTVNF